MVLWSLLNLFSPRVSKESLERLLEPGLVSSSPKVVEVVLQDGTMFTSVHQFGYVFFHIFMLALGMAGKTLMNNFSYTDFFFKPGRIGVRAWTLKPHGHEVKSSLVISCEAWLVQHGGCCPSSQGCEESTRSCVQRAQHTGLTGFPENKA